MIKSGDIIRHVRFLDVSVAVHDVKMEDAAITIEGEWVNQGFSKSYYLNMDVVLTITWDELKHWEKCADPHNYICLRNSPWLSLR